MMKSAILLVILSVSIAAVTAADLGVVPAPANGTAPAANATAPAAHPAAANATHPAAAAPAPAPAHPHLNVTVPSNSSIQAVLNLTNNIHNVTLPAHAAPAAAANSVVPRGSIAIVAPPPAYVPRRSSVFCPTCQPNVGRPNITSERPDASRIKLAAGPFAVSVMPVPGSGNVRLVLANDDDPAKARWSMSLSKVFASNATGINAQGVVPASQRFNQIDLFATPSPYTWEVTQPTTTHDDKTSMVRFQVTGTPSSSAVPSITFDQVVLANENRTTSKFDFKVSNTPDSFFKVALSNAPLNKFVAVYRLDKIDRLSQETPAKQVAVVAGVVTVPARPAANVTGHEQSVNVQVIRAGGLDFGISSQAKDGNNNNVAVSVVQGKDLDQNPVVYVIYDAFGATLVHDPYTQLNPTALDSPAFVAQPQFLLALLCVLAALFLQREF